MRNMGDRLPKVFYARETLTVARQLLGQRLVRVLEGERLSGRIVETEAYIGEADLACHAARGLTPRTAVMFGPPGRAYVYFIYGMHHCLNVVTEQAGFAAAVLIRALQPLEGLAAMRSHRFDRSDGQRLRLTDGPGKLCQALQITRELNGVDLATSDELFIEAGSTIPDEDVLTTPRVNVRGDERALTAPWRFCLANQTIHEGHEGH